MPPFDTKGSRLSTRRDLPHWQAASLVEWMRALTPSDSSLRTRPVLRDLKFCGGW